MNQKRVVIVGGGFAGMSCAKKLAADSNVHVTLLDQNNYHKFTPLLYQVATSALSSDDAATSLRHYFSGNSNIDIKMTKAMSIDPHAMTVMTAECRSYQGDYLVIAAGSVVNYFDTPGAEQYSFPLYNLIDAERLRSRILAIFEAADRDPSTIDHGILNIIIVGAGPTGTEVAGAIADMFEKALPKEFGDIAINKGCIYLIDHNTHVLGAFSKESQEYAATVLTNRGVKLCLGLLVKEVSKDHVILSNGQKILTQTIVWAGGLKAEALAEKSGLMQGHGGRINVNPDLTTQNFPNIYAVGDFANIVVNEGRPLPQLASVAQQSGRWAADNILRHIAGKPTVPFKYIDKGIMAMVGRNAAVAELGIKRRELKGFFAYIAWLTVHAALLSTWQQKIGAIFSWVWEYFSHTEDVQILDRMDVTQLD